MFREISGTWRELSQLGLHHIDTLESELLYGYLNRTTSIYIRIPVPRSTRSTIAKSIAQGSWYVVTVAPNSIESNIESLDTASSNRLEAVFGTREWLCATADEIDEELDLIPKLEMAIFCDVGQGACVGLLDDNSEVRVYFDVGPRIGSANLPFPPKYFNHCICAKPSIILSHWHADHWNGALQSTSLNNFSWIVPRQKGMGQQANLQAARIAKSGKLLPVKRSCTPIGTSGTQTVNIFHGTGSNLNDSGLCLQVERREGNSSLAWLFPGDCAYAEVPYRIREAELCVLQATHHGGKGSDKSVPLPGTMKYRRLVYSFGRGNTYGHPTSTSQKAHQTAGWDHANLSSSPIPYGADTRSTCLDTGTPAKLLGVAPGLSHTARASVAVGWDSVPLVPSHQLLHLPLITD